MASKRLPSSGAYKTLGDLVSLQRGTTYKGNLVGQPGPALLGLASISRHGGFRHSGFDTYGGPSSPRILLKPGDLYVSLKDVTQSADVLGAVARIPKTVSNGRLTHYTVGLIAKSADTPWSYLYWLLRTPQYRDFCSRHATGTTTLGLAREDFLGYPVPALDNARRSLTALLEAIENKIDELTGQSDTLERVSRAIFRSWFVDFDPVRAKAEGREPEGMDAATAALFPDSLIESALGPIPKGWKVSTVLQMCERISNGGTPSRSKPDYWRDAQIPWFKTGELSDSHLISAAESINQLAAKETNARILPRHSILMAIYASPTVGRLGILSQPSAFNQACTGMIARSDIGPWFLYLTLFNGRSWFNNRANGAAQQNISKAIVEGYSAVLPDRNLLIRFQEIANPLFEAMERNQRQAKCLSDIRDTLLPRLISGKLRVPEAEKLVEAVL